MLSPVNLNDFSSKSDPNTENEKVDKYKFTNLLKTHYETMKSKIFEAAEELRMRRILDKESEERINNLIQENFEITRRKDEEIAELLKSNNGLKQELQNIYQEFEKKEKIHDEDKAAQNISISSSSKAINSLKDEVLTLQLAKYGLEKKIKDQEHELSAERRSKVDMNMKIKEFQTVEEDLKSQFSSVKTRLEYLADLVVKTEKVHHRLAEVNEHNRCLISNYSLSSHAIQYEMNNSIARFSDLKTAVKNGNDSLELVKKENFEEQQLENEGLCIQLEKELHSIREHNVFLTASLSDSNHLLLLAEERLSDVSLQKDSIQIELNELRNENLNLHAMIKTKEEHLNESNLALKLKEQQLDDLRLATKMMEEQMNNFKTATYLKEEQTNNLKLETQLNEQAKLGDSQVLSQMIVQNDEEKSVEQERVTKSLKRKIDKQNISKHKEFEEKMAGVESENVNYDVSLDIGQVTLISSGNHVFIHNSNHLIVSESVDLTIKETDDKLNFSTLPPIDHKRNISSLESCKSDCVGISENDTEKPD